MKTRIVAAACAVALAGVFGAGTATAKTLVYCSEGSPENFNSMINTTGTTFDANKPVYNQLVQFRLGTTQVEPALAEKWEITDGGKVFVFHLRKNVNWQSNKMFKPSRTFNADDVIFSFDRQYDESNPYHKVSGGGYEYWGDMDMPNLIDKIEKVDDYTVKITLKKPNAPFLADMAMDFSIIQSKEYADTLLKAGKPELIDQQPIGTGPFEFVVYQKDTMIRYRRFDGFWGPKAKLDTLVFAITPDPAVRLAKLRANECQVMSYPNPADLASIKADPKLQLLSQPGLNIGYLALNVTKKPYDDVRVRRAMNMAIDRKAIIQAVYQGAGQEAKNLIPPTMLGYDNAIQQYPYDPAEAKNLLAAAGYPNGFATDLWAMPVQRPYNPDARRMAELMQADLAKIGVKAKIVTYEWGEYRKRMAAGEDQAGLLGWTGDNGDPDNFFVPLSSCAAARPGGGNEAKWCNKEFDDLINKAAAETDPAARAKLYEQAEVIMHREAPFVLIAHSIVYMPMSKAVVGYKISPLGDHRFDQVDLK